MGSYPIMTDVVAVVNFSRKHYVVSPSTAHRRETSRIRILRNMMMD
jgi:hypothetical protein